jgi:hypothetical protein
MEIGEESLIGSREMGTGWNELKKRPNVAT